MTSVESKMEEAQKYYNAFSKALTEDYIVSNPRTKSAIKHILAWLPKQTKAILDVGCGIGWTSFEVAKKRSSSTVFGVDLSPESIKIAHSLFEKNNLTFAQQDITVKDFQDNNRFDAVLLVDVYEHIPAEARAFFHQSIAAILNESGRIIITCPTALQQRWLIEHNKEGLQPIDEVITVKEIHDFATAVQGEVIYFAYKRIWDENDYFHAVIERQPKFQKIDRPLSEKIRDRIPFSKIIKENRVKSLLKKGNV